MIYVQHGLEVLMLLMVGLLLMKDGLTLFTAIQYIQGLQIILLEGRPGWEIWKYTDIANVILEIVSIVATPKYLWARLLMVMHLALKLAQYAMVDADFDFTLGPLFWARYWVNAAIIVVLIGYALRKENTHGSAAA